MNKFKFFAVLVLFSVFSAACPEKFKRPCSDDECKTTSSPLAPTTAVLVEVCVSANASASAMAVCTYGVATGTGSGSAKVCAMVSPENHEAWKKENLAVAQKDANAQATATAVCLAPPVVPPTAPPTAPPPTSPPPAIDVCPNISGVQETIPSGMIKDGNGNCVVPPVITAPTCSAQGSVQAGNAAVFTATGGNGTYTWFGNGSPSSASGSVFSTTYASAGTYSVTVSSAGMSNTCSVVVTTVPPPACVWSVDPVIHFTASGGQGSASVIPNRSDCPQPTWTSSGYPSWVTVNRSSGSGAGSIGVTAPSNPTTSIRSQVVTVTASDGNHTVTITQDAGVASCTWAVENATIGWQGGEVSASVTPGIGCSGNWSATTNNPQQLDLLTTGGSPVITINGINAGTVRGSVSTNNTTIIRTFTITWTGPGGISKTITVTQAAHP
ncbi:MAG: hypothetical protein KBD55_01265 [Candidatus Pacebacteria bacterium]|jgi:hypothetical protein|nr:hypothetical protein [Candidatus Paceibacterota bacterium]